MGKLIEIKVPDIGDFKDVPVIEVMVKAGDRVAVDEGLVTLESDKAIMDVPSPHSGVISEVKLRVGDKVSEGSPIALLETEDEAPHEEQSQLREPAPREHIVTSAKAVTLPLVAEEESGAPAPKLSLGRPTGKPHASPLARRFARDLGVDITRVEGGPPSGRILKADVERYVKTELVKASQVGPQGIRHGLFNDLPPWPKVDFTKFGPVEIKPLSRIRKISGPNLARNWVMIPHVTQFDEADVTELEALRKELNVNLPNDAVKITILAFVAKACVVALKKFPEFNASLEGSDLLIKRYFHIGFAVDTPDGLVVPVLRNVDAKGVSQIAKEMAELGTLARAGRLSLADIQGGSFTISSIGGIGGGAFTPIINAPEVAILGISRVIQTPVYLDGALVPRLIMPLSLSFDHRVIDGAVAARFTTYLRSILADLRRALL